MNESGSPSALVRFYQGVGCDGCGRGIANVLDASDDWLEEHHDFIQWLFPLPTRSGANPEAPILTPADLAAFRKSDAMRETMTRTFERMLGFYGLALEREEGKPIVRRGANWGRRRDNWLTPNNHNHLRLTRILISLRTLGLPELATALYEGLESIYRSEGRGNITETTFRFWIRAVA